MIRVVVADDHPVYLDGICMVLDGTPDVQVVGRAGDGAAAVDLVTEHRPDVALLDLRMPGTDGVEAIRRLRDEAPEVRTLVLTMLEDEQSASAALRAGASGYLVKGATSQRIVEAVRAVAEGLVVLGGPAATEVTRVMTSGRPDGGTRTLPQLTDREVEVLDLLARGLGNAAIAARVHLSEKTIRNYVSAIFAKLEVTDRARAVVVARDAGLGRS